MIILHGISILPVTTVSQSAVKGCVCVKNHLGVQRWHLYCDFVS